MNGDRPVVGVGVVLRDFRGHVLLGHRIKRGEPATWCLPGGHLEKGETFEEAAERELREETGLTSGTTRVFVVGIDTVGGGVTAGVVAEAVVAAGTVAGEPRVLEPWVFDSWDWWPLTALPEPLYPASHMLLNVLRGQPAPDGWSGYRVATTEIV